MTTAQDVEPIAICIFEGGLADELEEPVEASWLLKLKLFFRYRFKEIAAGVTAIVALVIYLGGSVQEMGKNGVGDSENMSSGDTVSLDGKDGTSEDVAAEILNSASDRTIGPPQRYDDRLIEYDPETIDVDKVVNARGVDEPAETKAKKAEVVAKKRGFEFKLNEITLDLPTSLEYETLSLSIGIDADEASANRLLSNTDLVQKHLDEIAAEDSLEALSIFQILDTLRMQLKIRMQADLANLNMRRVHVHDFYVETR